MRVLYLNYGTQSGVTSGVIDRFRQQGHTVISHDAVQPVLFKRRIGRVQIPNPLPTPLRLSAAAIWRHRRMWRIYYVHTTTAFDVLSDRCSRAIEREKPDVVLQAGVLFAPGRPGQAPTYLFCDHTRALAEAYENLPGIDPGIPFEQAWRDRETAVYRSVDGIFVMSEHVKRSLMGTYGVDPARVHVVGAGPNVAPRTLRTGPRPPVFSFVGIDFAPKGGPEAIEAFTEVRKSHPSIELWMVGNKQPRTAPEGVKLLGWLPFEEVGKVYERSGYFVLPTLREAFGLSYLEAMSYGLPCIGTRIEAIPEIIAEGETGLLVPPRDPRAVARAMAALLENPARADAMGEAGRRRIAEKFGWERALDMMLSVIRNAALPRRL